jgi:hypothetical protein
VSASGTQTLQHTPIALCTAITADSHPRSILAVNDVVSGVGSAWYDVTQLQDFVEDKEFEDQEAGSLFGFFHL